MQGVSTRKVQKITEELCGKEFKRSTISRYTKHLDEQVAHWRHRPLTGRYVFVLVDAIHLKVRQGASVESVALRVAVGLDEDGQRRILGCELGQSESYVSWLGSFRGLVRRGLTGVEVVTSDAHEGLVKAGRKVFVGAMWQRCQTHFRRNVSEAAPRRHRQALDQGLDEILLASSKAAAREAKERLCEELEGACDQALRCLEEGWEDACAVLTCPRSIASVCARRTWSSA